MRERKLLHRNGSDPSIQSFLAQQIAMTDKSLASKAPTTAPELVACFNALPEASDDRHVFNHWLISVRKVIIDDPALTPAEACSLNLWIVNPPTQRVHLERLPFPADIDVLLHSEHDVQTKPELIRSLAAPIALCLMKAFVEDFGRRTWSEADEQPGTSPTELQTSPDESGIGKAVGHILKGLGVRSQLASVNTASEADVQISNVGWAQFVRKIHQMAQQHKS